MVLKRGFFFTIDSLVGASIIIIGLLLVNSFYIVEPSYTSLDYTSHDLISALSTLRINEVTNPYVDELISAGEITNTDNSILEQIGEFWVLNKTELCQGLAENMTFGLFPSNIGFSIAIGNDEIFRKETPATQNLVSARKMISGYEKGRPISGLTARAYLKSIREKKTASFAYFGGFVGQGNISRELEYIPSDAIIDNAFIEFDAGTDFNFYINGVLCGSFSPVKQSMVSTRWNISSCTFSRGIKNNLSIVFTGLLNESFIAGGYVKVEYRTSEMISNSPPEIKYYYFPGIEGLINLYSSFDIPGTLKSADFYIHFYNNKTTFMNIGNKTIFTTPGSSEDQIVNITGYTLPIQPETIPLRLGVYNISEEINITSGEPADSVLVTDVSGSMNDCGEYGEAELCRYECCNFWFFGCWSWKTMECLYTGSCSGDQCNTCASGITRNHEVVTDTGCLKTLMDLAKEAALLFVDVVLNITGNKIGAVSYESSVRDVEPLTDSKITLQNEINGYYAEGGTCICCGINRAKDMLLSSSNEKFMVVMSDGAATMYCDNFNDYTGSGTGGTSDPIDTQWAIDAGQNACNQNITVFTVGFGENADHETLKQIACDESLYYDASNVLDITEIYQEIGKQILIIANYSSQVISVTGEYTKSILYPDSYIMFNFTPIVEPPSFGEIELVIETDKFDSCINTVNIPNKIRITDARALSYSGPHWTSFLAVNGNTIFNINKYGSDYRNIGDPFVLQIPPNILTNGSNQIELQTADSPENLTGCSKNNSMIYTAAIKSSVTYTDVLPEAEGCIWTIETEDSKLITALIPSGYSGTNLCSYTGSDINFNRQDSINLAVYKLLSNLDFDDNGKININIDEEDLEIETLQVSKIPYLWGPLIVEVRTWH